MAPSVSFLADSPVVWRPASLRDIQRFLGVVSSHGLLRAATGSSEGLTPRMRAWPGALDQSLVRRSEPGPTTPGSCLDPAPTSGAGHDATAVWLACASLPGEPIAFVMLDGAERTLLVVRDFLGCIPISVATDARGGILLASRAESIARHLDSGCRIDEGRIADLLVRHLQWLDLSATFYRQIRRVPGGCFARIRGDRITIERYWRPRVAELPGDWTSADYSQELRDRLQAAVSACLPDDGSLPAVMLSGGIDSNAVAGLAVASLRHRDAGCLPTYSVVDSGTARCSETAAIRQAMAVAGLDATALDLSAIGHLLPALQQAMFDVDEPWDANLSLLRWVYGTAADRGQRYVMDGIDADSLLGEADPVVEIARQIRRLQFPSAIRNARGLDRHWEGGGRVFRQMLLAATWQAAVPGRLRGALLRRRRSVTEAAGMAALLEGSPIRPDFARAVDLLARQSRYASEEQEQGVLDLRGPIVGVERYARAAARAGVVPLHPFLDTRVVEFCLALPQCQRLAEGWPKFVLRSAMRGVVPDQVAWRHGKRHLGWRLTRTLAAQLSPPLHVRLAGLKEVLDPYVDPGWLRRLTGAPATADEEIGWTVDLVALGRWLRDRQHCL